MVTADFASRKHGDILVLFDVDETLTPARRGAKPEMLAALEALRKNYVIGFVGGSDFNKQVEQLGVGGRNILNDFDYCFSENGLTAYKQGQPLESQSWIGYIGEDRYKQMVKFILHYIADLDIPIKRGTFIEFRRGMINVSPIGRNASIPERLEFEAYDKVHNIRKQFIAKLKEEFPDFGLTYSIGGQISFDVFPTGWNKTYALRHVEKEGFKEIHFFGDKTDVGGNDHEIYSDPRTIGHSVHGPEDTLQQVTDLFLSKN